MKSRSRHVICTAIAAVGAIGAAANFHSALAATPSLGYTAFDNAAESAYAGSNWTGNGGYGYGAWTFSVTGGSGGRFMGSSNGNGGATGIDTSGSSWGLFANSSGTSDAVRSFNNGLAIGQTFSIDIDNGSIDNGDAVGFGLRNASDQNVFEFFGKGGNTSGSDGAFAYTLNGSPQQFTNFKSGSDFTNDGIHAELTLTSASTYTITLSGPSLTTQTLTGTTLNPAGGQAITKLRLFNSNAGNGSTNNVYFNSTVVYLPTWNGQAGATGNWSTAGNWAGHVPVDGGAIAFDGGSGAVISNNDMLSSVYSIVFNGTVAGTSTSAATTNATTYTLTGSALTINGGITNNSSNLQTISIPVTLGTAQTFDSGGSAGGDLTLSNTINTNGRRLTVAGVNTTNLKNVVSGNGGITKNGDGTLILSGTSANSFSGSTILSSGTLLLNKTSGQDAIVGALTINGGTVVLGASNQINDTGANGAVTVNAGGTFNLNGKSEVVGALAVNGGSVVIGSGTLNTGSPFSMTGGVITSTGTGQLKLGKSPTLANSNDGLSPATISGTLNLNGATRTFTINHNGSGSTIDADISANIIESGTGQGVTKDGSGGTMRLSGANSYSGTTTVSAGTLILAGSNSNSVETAINGGTLMISADSNLGAVPSSLDATNIQFGGGTLVNTAAVSLDANRGLTLTGAGNINANQNADLVIHGPIAGANRLTVTGNSLVTLNGVVGTTSDILKQGSGTLLLANSGNSFGTGGNNVFIDKGTVQISASGAAGTSSGLINIGASSASPAGDGSLLITTAGVTLANPIDSRFFSAVSSGKTIGGSNTSGIATFSGGVTLHDNTTLVAAAGGQVDFTGPIATGSVNGSETVNATPPTGGFGAGPGIIINSATAAGGVVELTGPGTYTGDTVVNSGTLQYNGSFSGASTIRLGASSGSQNASLSIATPTGATFSKAVNVRPGSSGVKTISAANMSGATTTFSNQLALDDNATILSTNAGATLAITQLRSSPSDTSTGFDIKGFTATFDGAGDTNVSGTIYNSTGNGNIIKQGNGNLTLSANNTYSGTTTVSAGTLIINGTHSGGGAYTVSGGTLGGGGTIATSGLSIQFGGTISPGNSPGTMTVNGDVSIAGTYLCDVDFNNTFTMAPTADKILVNGTSDHSVSIDASSSTLQLQFVNVPSPSSGGPYTVTIIDNTTHGTTPGADQFKFVVPSHMDTLVSYTVHYNQDADGDGQMNDVTVTFDAVPEPTSIGLLGLLAMAKGRRRRAV